MFTFSVSTLWFFFVMIMIFLYSIMIKISVNFVLLLLFCFCNVATRFVQFSIIWRICIKQSGGSFSFITSWQCSDKIRKYQGHIETFGRRKKIKILMRFPEIKTKNLFYYWTDNRILVPRHQRYGAPILLLVDILLVNPFTCW